jgi:cephalosporin-C deacetylase-like acetyl esterase
MYGAASIIEPSQYVAPTYGVYESGPSGYTGVNGEAGLTRGMRVSSYPRVLCSMLVVVVVALAAPSLASAEGEPAPFGHACKAQDGVRFCPTEGLTQRVATFDGVPLDVDVTLPATGKGPFPTIVMLHGWGGSKTDFESSSPSGDGNETFDYNNVYYAQHGYAVVNYSARGWGQSCGSAESRKEVEGCKEGWIRLADQRYEVRDTQYLLGLLVDEHIAKRGALASTGISYGGGQSIELAHLKNRIRLPGGEFAPWTSPKGTPLSITATFPRWPWSDLVDALTPNGRFLDTEIAPFAQSYEPFGVEIQSYVTGLYGLGNASGYIAPEGLDPEADLTKWFAATNTGEPATPEDEAIAKQLYTYHQGYGLPGTPAPMLLESGWTDDLFPPSQSLRVYNAVHKLKGYASLMVGDLGHSRGSNKENTDHAFNEEAASFFAAKLQHVGSAPLNGSVTAYTQTCPKSAPGGGPFTAKSWSRLHLHAVSFGSEAAQTLTSAGGNPTIATEFDPIAGTSDACKTVTTETEPNTANYTMLSEGFTLLGLPTVKATIKTTGLFGELVSRLWDVLPGGQQRLISRGVNRLNENQSGAVTFQLHGNGYQFPAGDTVKLQLLGRDAPYYRASNGTFSVEVSNLTVSLPTP